MAINSIPSVSHTRPRLCSAPLQLWIHNHPTTIKVIKVAGLVLGSAMLVAAACAFPWVPLGVVIGLGLGGAVVAAASLIVLRILGLVVPTHHDMRHHVFTPGQCEGGRLYYEGDVPILSITTRDPVAAGKAHGYLCGEAIDHLAKRFCAVTQIIGASHPLAKDLSEVRRWIPSDFLREMEGVVAGYNQWADEHHRSARSRTVTLDYLLLLHLIPDLGQRLSDAHVACSSIIDSDEQSNPLFARNLDWPSLGVTGTYSLVISRKHPGRTSTVEVGFPSFIGTLTDMNAHGVALAMNVASGDVRLGMPSVFFNRVCLEDGTSVAHVARFVRNHSALAPYHMTVADEASAASFHMYLQTPNLETIRVDRQWDKVKPLVTLNCSYLPEPFFFDTFDTDRQQSLDRFFNDRDGRPLEEALSQSYVNNAGTVHRVVMNPKLRIFKVAFDNSFAGDVSLHSLPMQQLL
jgi:hypothetical protein